MRFKLGSNRVTSKLTQMNWVLRCDFGYSAQPGNYILWFCIPKSLQNIPKSAQIPKSYIWDMFSSLGLAKPFFFPSPNLGQIWIRIQVLGSKSWYSYSDGEFDISNSEFRKANFTTRLLLGTNSHGVHIISVNSVSSESSGSCGNGGSIESRLWAGATSNSVDIYPFRTLAACASSKIAMSSGEKRRKSRLPPSSAKTPWSFGIWFLAVRDWENHSGIELEFWVQVHHY